MGRAVVAALNGADREVVATSRSGETPLDVEDARAVATLLDDVRPEVVVYLVGPGADADDAAGDRATRIFADFVESAGRSCVRRIVFTSSASVYGRDRVGDVTAPATPYARHKLACEGTLQDAAASGGMSTASLRLFNVYGPALDRSLINRILSGSAPTVWASGVFVRDYVHASDAARAILLAADGESFGADVADVGTGRGVSNRDLIRLAPSGAVVADPSPIAPTRVVADPHTAEALWGFRTRVRLEEAFAAPSRYL